jgi:hypothetical protein
MRAWAELSTNDAIVLTVMIVRIVRGDEGIIVD